MPRLCPTSSNSGLSEARLNTVTVLSHDPRASRVPAGLNATSDSWPDPVYLSSGWAEDVLPTMT